MCGQTVLILEYKIKYIVIHIVIEILRNIKCVTLFYVLLLFGHNLVKNAHKSDLFRPKILKWFLYKPNQSVLRYLYISRKIDENTKKRQIWVLPFICTDTIKSTEKILIFTFLSFLKFDSVKLAILEGIYALIILKHNIGQKLMYFKKRKF